MSDAPALKRSTRDLDETRKRLERWLAAQLPEGAGPTVGPVSAPESNGMSSETLLFSAEWGDDGARAHRELVARVAPDPRNVPVFPSYDLEKQFRVIQLVGELSDVPVPSVLWFEPDDDAIGAPFFVMERVDGVVPPDLMPYNFGDSWLFDASREDQTRLQEATVAVLADLHAIPDPASVFAFLDSPRPEPTALRRHVGGQGAYYEWASEGLRSPLIEAAFTWLDDHWPADEGPTVLSWGDSRIGNILYRDFEPVAVLDWEMASLAPPEVDVAWCTYMHRWFEDLATGYGFPGMPAFLRRDDVAAAYEQRTGYAPRNLDFFEMYAALRYAIVSLRVQRRAVHFGEMEMPDDPDDLIMGRGTIESLLAART